MPMENDCTGLGSKRLVVKLIQPRATRRPMDTGLKLRMAPHLGLLTIAGIVEAQGHSVLLVNENVAEDAPTAGVDLVGISTTLDVLGRAHELALAYQALGVPVAVGGIGVTADPDYAQALFGTICIGPAEGHWPELLGDAAQGRLKRRYSTPPDYSGEALLPPSFKSADMAGYLYSNVIATSRGCPFRCDFCYNSATRGTCGYVHRTVESVLAEIRSKRTRHIMFIDDNFIGNPAFTRELLAAIAPLRLKWNAAVSANILEMPDLLDQMRETGCKSLFIGIESLNGAALKDVHKGQNRAERYEELVEALHSRGIMVNASFVFGLDEDDAGVFDRTIDWIVKHRIESATSHILTPYPGTELYRRMEADGRIFDHDFSHYDTAHVVFTPRHMTPQELYDGYLRVYREVFSLKNIWKRMPLTRRQVLPYLLFNLFYRKYGHFTECLGNLVGFHRLGRLARWLSYHIG